MQSAFLSKYQLLPLFFRGELEECPHHQERPGLNTSQQEHVGAPHCPTPYEVTSQIGSTDSGKPFDLLETGLMGPSCDLALPQAVPYPKVAFPARHPSPQVPWSSELGTRGPSHSATATEQCSRRLSVCWEGEE